MSQRETLDDLLAVRESALEAARRDRVEAESRFRTVEAEHRSLSRRRAAAERDAREAHGRLLSAARRGSSGAELGDLSQWRAERLSQVAALAAQLDGLGDRMADAEATLERAHRLEAQRLGERDALADESATQRRSANRTDVLEAEGERDTLAAHRARR